MKRLTISMSDELFEKLDRIENKSLFIRKLLERELEMLEDVSATTTEPWVPDINILKGSVDELFLKLSEIEKHLNGKIIACPGPESASELLASGSLIAYKNRPLPHIANEAANPIIIPLATEKCAADAIQVTAPEPLQVEMDKLSSFHSSAQLPTDLSEIPMGMAEFRQELLPSACENITMPNLKAYEVPAGCTIPETLECNLQIKHLSESHAAASELKEQNVIASQQVVIPEFSRQLANLSELALARPEPDRERIPEGETSSIAPDMDFHKIHESQTAPFMPDSNQHIISLSEPSPVSPDFKQHVSPVTEQTQAGPDTGLHVIPLSKTESHASIFDQQVMPTSKHELIMPNLNQHVVPVNEHVPMALSFNDHISHTNEEVTHMPVFGQREKKMDEHVPMMPAFNQHLPKEQGLVMPELSQQAGPGSGPNFVIPELKPQATTSPKTEFVMPEFKAPFNNFMDEQMEVPMGTRSSGPALTEGYGQMTPAVSPFNIPGQTAGPAGADQPLFRLHEMPEPANTEKMPPFIAPSMPETLNNAQVPQFMESQPAAVPPSQQHPKQPLMDRSINQTFGKNAKPGKLEGNILMYMPRGAKVKRSIIKSLVSKQFSDNEIEAKISELVSAGVLMVNADNGEQYLVRP